VAIDRDAAADALKGLAMTLVVLGHAVVTVAWVYHAGPGLVRLAGGWWVTRALALNVPLNFINAFHIPLFAFVSGLLAWRPVVRPLLDQLRRRSIGILVPYASWVVVYYFFLVRPMSAAGFAAYAGSAALNPWGGLWFLYALFVSYVVLLLVQRLPRHTWVLGALSLIAVCATAYPVSASHLLGFGDVLYILPFFAAGYLMAPLAGRIRERKWLVAGVAGVATPVLFWMRWPVLTGDVGLLQKALLAIDPILRGRYHIPYTFVLWRFLPALARYGASLAAIIAVFALYQALRGPALDVQAWVGRRTLGIYAIHQLLMAILLGLGVRDWLVMFVLALGLSIGITLLLERVPVVRGLLLGRWGRSASGDAGGGGQAAPPSDPQPDPV
jgi:fucose 4-O-acetylase-like acetyltransferase